MTATVDYSRKGAVALIRIAHPPVNALSQALRAGLEEAALRFASDEAAQVAVLYGAGKLFIGGADITEFGKPPLPPFLPGVIAQLEASAKPVAALIHGAALGGGLEVALACHYRMALEGATLGLPEVKLGVIPGAGGTQRMPRLTGIETALQLIPAGGTMGAAEALACGLVDRTGPATDDIAGAAHAFGQALLDEGAPPRPTSALPGPAAPEDGFDAHRARIAKRSRGEVAPLAALDAIEAGTRMPFDQAMTREREIFLEMLKTPQRAGLIHAFFNDRKVARLDEIKGIEPRPIAHVGVIGGGTMGAGIAAAALMAGLRVTLSERDAEAAAKARSTIAATLEGAVRRGKLTAAGRDAQLQALDCVTGFDALAQADLIIEAVFEDMGLKKEIFAQLGQIARPGAVLATNTSYLDVNEIAAASGRPADVLGLHFFSPAHVMKLLEVVVADATAPEVTATGFALAKRLGKTAVRAGVCDGFIGNRILSHYRAAADAMVMQGASPFDVDRALTGFGFAMGPYAVADLAGLDIGYMTRQRKAATRSPHEIVPTWADALYHAGRLGRKTGRGYYIYDEDSPRGRPDPEALALVEEARAAAGITPRSFSDDEIVERYMAAMVNEGARTVEEGIARRPLDVDVTLLYGYGFPRWRGGPMKYADSEGLQVIADRIARYAQDDPHFWQPSALLTRLARDGQTFDSLNG